MMTERVKKKGGLNESAAHAPGFSSLLVPVDLTPISDRVVGRVGLLPLTDDARVTLLHVIPRELSVRAQTRAARDATTTLKIEARHLAQSLPRSVTIAPVVKVGAAPAEIAACADSTKAEMIVMGRGGSGALRDVFLGSTAERVIRRGKLPVLAVRLRPRGAYSRPAVALDLDQAAPEVLSLILRMIAPPRPRIALIHAVDLPYGGIIYPSLPTEDAEEWRREVEHRAAQKIGQLCITSLARTQGHAENAGLWMPHIRSGSPRFVIEKAVKKAETDLLALGTHGYSGIAHLFLGTVAGDVLRAVPCDVLVVPGPR